MLHACVAMGITFIGAGARADDKLLKETVEFTGSVLFLQSHLPALVIAVVRDGRTAVFGFGETSNGSGKPPDRHTLLRVGSLTKAFTGQVLASLVADGTVSSQTDCRTASRAPVRLIAWFTDSGSAGSRCELSIRMHRGSGTPRIGDVLWHFRRFCDGHHRTTRDPPVIQRP
jgi:hypothetical protein